MVKTPNGPPEWRRQPGQSILNVQRWGEGVTKVAPDTLEAQEKQARDAHYAMVREKSLGKDYGIIADRGILTEKKTSTPLWRRALYRLRVIFRRPFR